MNLQDSQEKYEKKYWITKLFNGFKADNGMGKNELI